MNHQLNKKDIYSYLPKNIPYSKLNNINDNQEDQQE